ncbi:MAG: ISAzo13 family transposase [Gammaproteobacteria bacterium]|nr:ISAzo13 family transposase [Gammaproteobacteria bacterium]
MAIPHGIYDIQLNAAYINIGMSHDTCEFSCDSIRRWWNVRGRYDYPAASSILVLVDCGGSNGYRHYVFKRAIQQLSDAISVEICIAYYPSNASKWNSIEYRLFPHITRKLKGVILKSVEIVKQLIEATTTKSGLTVKCNIIRKIYKTGKKMSKEEKENLTTIHDDYLGHWNYKEVPSNS